MPTQPGRADYDQALKRLLAQAPDGFTSLIAPDLRWRGDRPTELPSAAREADLVWEVEAADGRVGLLHVELQTKVEDDLGERLAEYGIRLMRQHHLPVRSVVVFLREARNLPAPPFTAAWSSRELLRYDYDVVPVWTLPQRLVLETSHYALWPLAGLMEGVTPQTTVDVAERIARAPLPLEYRRELTSHLALLAGRSAKRRLSPDVVQELLRRNGMLEELLRESSVAEMLRQEGRQEGARAIVQTVLEGRFGTLPADVLAALSRADDATLHDLALHASSDSLDQIGRRLGLA